MPNTKRRELLQLCAVVAGSLTLPPWTRVLAANSCPTLTRYSAASPEGKSMLHIYAVAIRKMMDTTLYPEGSPLSWMFQWYTHMVRGDLSKEQELSRVYPSGSANQALAAQMWDTCQSHIPGEPEAFFLPWHRMYVTYFEQIIRQVSGDECFTLPYWDYTDPAHQALPEEFRQKDHPIWGALYRENRRPAVNSGESVSQGPDGADLNLECMRSTNYSRLGGDAGFCSNTDQAPHGALHVAVGNSQGMGAVPWAASDPIFWLHHCNIDRIWASWNRAGGNNPSNAAFLNTQFIFASRTGGMVRGTVKDVLTSPKNTYDQYLPRPAGSPPFPKSPQSEPKLFSLHAASAPIQESGPIALGNKATVVELVGQKTSAPRELQLQTFSTQLGAVKRASPVYLVLEGLSALGVVSGVFNVYVHGSPEVPLDRNGPAFVGQLNFFGAASHNHNAAAALGASSMVAGDKAISFLLSSATRELLKRSGELQPKVTLVPATKISDEAAPTITRIALIAE